MTDPDHLDHPGTPGTPGTPGNLDSPENTYVIDSEQAAELARLMQQDRQITAALGGLLPEFPQGAPLPPDGRVLDLACAPSRLLKPGGVIRLAETEGSLTTSPAAERYSALFAGALKRAGQSFSADGRHIGRRRMTSSERPTVITASTRRCYAQGLRTEVAQESATGGNMFLCRGRWVVRAGISAHVLGIRIGQRVHSVLLSRRFEPSRAMNRRAY
jgi:hypothetical protein